MRTYGQYCPIARTSELLAERWTPILIRNLLAGCRTFGDMLAGAPGISRGLLAQRLELLEREGIISRTTTDAGRIRAFYDLTPKGEALRAVTEAMGRWGAQWIELEPHHTDPAYVLWATSKLVDLDAIPAAGLTVRFDLHDVPGQIFWMLLRRPRAEVCSSYPGRDEDLVVTSDADTLARWHLRLHTYAEAAAAGRLHIAGPPTAVRQLLASIRPSPFAQVQPGP